MSKARNLADLLDASGDVSTEALDNVPPSNDASALTTGTLPVDRVPYVGRRNLIINGAMELSQRGDYTGSASFHSYDQYRVDRWKHRSQTVDAMVQHTTITVDGTPFKALKTINDYTGTGYMRTAQVIEIDNVKHCINQQVTASAYVKSNYPVYIGVFDGNATTYWSNAHTGDGTVQRLTVTFTMPSSLVDPVEFYVNTNNGANTTVTVGDYFEFTMAQLELGSVATPFEHRSYGEELALCQRYFNVVPTRSWLLVGDGSNTGVIRGSYNFPVQMRAEPTCNSFTLQHVNRGWSIRRTVAQKSVTGLQGVNYSGVDTIISAQMGWNTGPINCDAEL